MNEKVKAHLIDLASKVCWGENDDQTPEDDFVVDDYAGGNVDDAYYGGERSGEIQLARWIVKELDLK